MTLVRMSASKVTELCHRIRASMNVYEDADRGKGFWARVFSDYPCPYGKADRKRVTRILDFTNERINSTVDLSLEDVIWLLENAGPSVEL